MQRHGLTQSRSSPGNPKDKPAPNAKSIKALHYIQTLSPHKALVKRQSDSQPARDRNPRNPLHLKRSMRAIGGCNLCDAQGRGTQ
jgi:hypothetical protein